MKKSYHIRAKHKADDELFHSGITTISVDSPFPADNNKNVKYFARSVYGGFDLHDAEGNKISHISSGTAYYHRIYDQIYTIDK
jgi:hypothetical protein